jgi:hypothetical protein
MEATIELDEFGESMLEELMGQYAYFLDRDPNEEEIKRFFRMLFLRSVRNHIEIGNSIAAYAGCGFPYDPGWRNFSQEEIDEEGFEGAPPISEC